MAELTTSARTALTILDAEDGRIKPADFARLMWPEHPAWATHEGPPRPADVVYTAGGYLGRLRAKGWVDVNPDGAILTTAGRAALYPAEAEPTPALPHLELAKPVLAGPLAKKRETLRTGIGDILAGRATAETVLADVALVDAKTAAAATDEFAAAIAAGDAFNASLRELPVGPGVADPRRRRSPGTRGILGGRRSTDPAAAKHKLRPNDVVDLDGVRRCGRCLIPVRSVGGAGKGYIAHDTLHGGSLPA